MTNQMKIVLKLSLILSVMVLGLGFITLAINGFSMSSVVSYVLLGANIVITISLGSLYLQVREDDKVLLKQIANARKLLELRQSAILDFYSRHGIKPQYDKDGNLIDPDRLLGILTKLDADGKLSQSIYEILGIEPVFDSEGKEIPIIIVLKHMIKSVRTARFDELKKISKLHSKGGEKGKTADKSNQKAKQQAKESGGKKKSGGGKALKAVAYQPSLIPVIKKADGKFSKKPDTKKKEQQNKPPQKEEPKRQAQPTTVVEETQSIPVTQPVESEFLKRMYSERKPETIVVVQPTVTRESESAGECTPE